MTSNDTSGPAILLAFLGGAALGAGVALLTAPRSGAETRERIGGAVRRGKDQVKSLPPAVRDAYAAASSAAKDAFNQTYEAQLGNGSAG